MIQGNFLCNKKIIISYFESNEYKKKYGYIAPILCVTIIIKSNYMLNKNNFDELLQ